MTNIDSQDFDSEESINFREIFHKYVYRWPVFLLGIISCLTVAFFYIRYTPLVYAVNSTLLIKDEKKGVSPAGGDLLKELDIFGASKVVDNEIEVFKSKTLMRRVVSRLNLMISYHVEGRIMENDIYASKPVTIVVAELDSIWYGKRLDLSFPNQNTYLIEDPISGKKVKGLLDSLQRTTYGVFKVEKNKNFNTWTKKNTNSAIQIDIHDPNVVANKYLNDLTLALVSKQSSVLGLTIATTVPQRGIDILNNLVQVYNESALADKNRTIQNTMDFIDIRIKLINGELKEVEKDVENYKSERGITTMSNDANMFLENVKTNDAQLSEINLKISVVQDIQRYVNSPSVQEKLPSTMGINDPVLLGQITQLGELQLQKDKLLATTGANNPILDPLISQIETTRAGIKSSIDNISKSLNNNKKTLLGNEAQIQSNIRAVPGQERQLISIERQKSIKETIYLYLLQKKEEAQLSYAASVADTRIVDPAIAQKEPIKPRKQLIFLGAFLLGILLPVGYIYSKEALKTRIENTKDVTKLTATPILGEILYEDDADAIVVKANSRNAIAEQFRALRTNMQFLHGKNETGKGIVTLVTSSMSGEGKTFVACNIAAAMAISGKKTVLLELDLRKPKVSKYLQLSNQTGLSNYLIGKAGINDIIQPTQVSENLYIIGSGPIPPNPSELLLQLEIENLVTYLRSNFDEILIDTPPIGLVTDAQILARLANASLYLVRQDVTFKDQVSQLENLRKQQKFPKLNVVLNGVKQSRGYGYGYGYYADDHTKRKGSFKTLRKNISKRF